MARETPFDEQPERKLHPDLRDPVRREEVDEALRESGFLRGPERHAVRDLHATLRRARLSPREARLWIAALKGIKK